MQTYEKGVVQIPVAALTVEDAEMLLRLYRRGERMTIRLEMEDRNLDPYVSRNTISELQGRTYAVDKKVVVVSGHLDRWENFLLVFFKGKVENFNVNSILVGMSELVRWTMEVVRSYHGKLLSFSRKWTYDQQEQYGQKSVNNQTNN